MPCWTRRKLKSRNLPPLNPRELHSDYNTNRDVFVLIGEQCHRLMEYNREWLLDPTTLVAEEVPASQIVTPQPERVSP